MGGPPFPPVVTLPLNQIRRVSMLNLEHAQRTTAPVTVVAEADVTGLVSVRESLKPLAERHLGMPLTYLPFFAMATIRALKAFPIMNAMLTPQGFIIPRYINLGIATSVPGGVLLPVVPQAERMGFWDLARAIYIQTQKARAGLLTPQELSGHTFVITNTGRWGATLFGTPIIQPPNVGILAFEAIQKRPVVTEDDQLAIRPMMYLSLTADHRAMDGAEMIGFLATVRQALEQVAM